MNGGHNGFTILVYVQKPKGHSEGHTHEPYHARPCLETYMFVIQNAVKEGVFDAKFRNYSSPSKYASFCNRELLYRK